MMFRDRPSYPDRRQVALGGLLVLVGYPIATSLGLDLGTADEFAGSKIASLARAFAGADRLGAAFLQSSFSEGLRTTTSLIEALSDSVAPFERQQPDLPSAFRRAVARDFNDGRICFVEHWYLSMTECQLAGLHALLNVPFVETPQAGAPAVARGVEEPLATAQFVQIDDWGPKSGVVRTPFNVQPNGRSAFWITATTFPAWVKARIDDKEFSTSRGRNTITFSIPDAFLEAILAEPGTHEVLLIDPALGRRQRVGLFVVHSHPGFATLSNGSVSKVFCKVSDWGPRSAKSGIRFNEQQDGSSAFWITTSCAPSKTSVFLGDVKLKTTVREGAVTGSLRDLTWLPPSADLPVALVDGSSSERLEVGIFTVRP